MPLLGSAEQSSGLFFSLNSQYLQSEEDWNIWMIINASGFGACIIGGL